jgi:hypothetical protein
MKLRAADMGRAASLSKIRHDRQTTGVVGMAVDLCATSAVFAFICIGAVNILAAFWFIERLAGFVA